MYLEGCLPPGRQEGLQPGLPRADTVTSVGPQAPVGLSPTLCLRHLPSPQNGLSLLPGIGSEMPGLGLPCQVQGSCPGVWEGYTGPQKPSPTFGLLLISHFTHSRVGLGRKHECSLISYIMWLSVPGARHVRPQEHQRGPHPRPPSASLFSSNRSPLLQAATPACVCLALPACQP